MFTLPVALLHIRKMFEILSANTSYARSAHTHTHSDSRRRCVSLCFFPFPDPEQRLAARTHAAVVPLAKCSWYAARQANATTIWWYLCMLAICGSHTHTHRLDSSHAASSKYNFVRVCAPSVCDQQYFLVNAFFRVNRKQFIMKSCWVRMVIEYWRKIFLSAICLIWCIHWTW